jgi:predicted nuclease of predicted toxin-antitoxin system
VPPKLLLDEHLSSTLAHRLTDMGFDVTSVRDRGLLGFEDWDLTEWCDSEGRAVCTRNAPDFRKEHEKYLARGKLSSLAQGLSHLHQNLAEPVPSGAIAPAAPIVV